MPQKEILRYDENRKWKKAIRVICSFTDDDYGLLKVQIYFQGAVVFCALFKAKTSEIRVYTSEIRV